MANRPILDFDAIKIASVGRWIDVIFPAIGIHFEKQPKKHQPCPICGGKDRFRCDDKQGTGTWICSQCGSGTGFGLVERVTNTSGYDLMAMIGGILGVTATKSITPEIRKKWKAEQQAKEKAEQQAKIQRQNEVANLAFERWQKASPHGQSDYLVKKGVLGFGVRFEKNTLLIPLATWNGQGEELRNLQQITADGSKYFIKGGQVNDCYHSIGNPDLFINPPIIMICEGYATGASVFMAIEGSTPIFVAFNADNLVKVAKVLRQRYPHTRILILADDDTATAHKMRQSDIDNGKQPKPLEEYNAGIKKARKVSQIVGAEFIAPNFTHLLTKVD
nr:primase-helicase zinc-binding domain-containing protein [uncultured Moraxella sp.]